MLFGDRLKVREVTLSEMKEQTISDPRAFSECEYALSAKGTASAFTEVMGRSWVLASKNRNGHLLFMRKGSE